MNGLPRVFAGAPAIHRDRDQLVISWPNVLRASNPVLLWVAGWLAAVVLWYLMFRQEGVDAALLTVVFAIVVAVLFAGFHAVARHQQTRPGILRLTGGDLVVSPNRQFEFGSSRLARASVVDIVTTSDIVRIRYSRFPASASHPDAVASYDVVARLEGGGSRVLVRDVLKRADAERIRGEISAWWGFTPPPPAPAPVYRPPQGP